MFLLAAFSVFAGPFAQAGSEQPRGGSEAGFKILAIYPHDPEAFTQGLLFLNGFLYESTGLYGRSSMRQVDVESGRVLKLVPLPANHFGEGLAAWGERFVQLTWKSRIALVYWQSSFRKEREIAYPWEGWGLASDGDHLIASDGSDALHVLDPVSLKEVRRLEVRDHGRQVRNLNELEMVGGQLLANIWLKDAIARISPETGEVLGWIDCSALRAELGPDLRAEALNGIAYDAKTGRVFVTGKLWPKLFVLELTEPDTPGAVR